MESDAELPRAANGGTPEKLSLCICTMNRPEELATALRSVREGTEQPHELIVSDDGDGSARDVAARFGAKYLEGPRRGLGANRNACIAVATGSALGFIDDDVVVTPGFVAAATAAARPDAVVTGCERNHQGDNVRRVTPHNASFLGFQHVPPSRGLRAIVINAAVFPASLFARAVFDEQVRYGYEEIDITRQALRLGYRVHFDETLVVDHFPSPRNRAEYSRTVEASRLYLTYKNYRDYDGSRPKATAFAVLGSAHHLAHAVRSGAGLATGVATLRLARQYWRAGRGIPDLGVELGRTVRRRRGHVRPPTADRRPRW